MSEEHTIMVNTLNPQISEGFEFVRIQFNGQNVATNAQETVFTILKKADFYTFSNIVHKCALETKAYEAHLLTDEDAASAKKAIYEVTAAKVARMEGNNYGLLAATIDQQVVLLSLHESLATDLQSMLPEASATQASSQISTTFAGRPDDDRKTITLIFGDDSQRHARVKIKATDILQLMNALMDISTNLFVELHEEAQRSDPKHEEIACCALSLKLVRSTPTGCILVIRTTDKKELRIDLSTTLLASAKRAFSEIDEGSKTMQ